MSEQTPTPDEVRELEEALGLTSGTQPEISDEELEELLRAVLEDDHVRA